MPSILLAYGTTTGQMAEIALRMDDVLAERGFDVTRHDLDDGDDAEPAAFDAVLLGAPVTAGALQPSVVAFVERHAETLSARPSGFAQLSLAPPVPWPAGQQGSRDRVDAIVDATGWEPDRVGLFEGTLPISELSLPQRLLATLASRIAGEDGDPSIEETSLDGTSLDGTSLDGTSLDGTSIDWDAVDDFAVTFGEFVEIELATAVPHGEPADAGGRSRLRSVGRALGAIAVVGAALWAIRRVVGSGRFDALEPEIEEIDLPADGPRAARTFGAEEPGSVPGETIDVEQA